jgi:DNA (cytosine-5)-methyltransferase 1
MRPSKLRWKMRQWHRQAAAPRRAKSETASEILAAPASLRAEKKVLDTFSGIGGFSLGLERAGFETVAFCEKDTFCQCILRERWPHVPIYDDIRTLTAARLRADGIHVDVIAGGFPCTDISVAGKGAGLAGPQSGLWWEYFRLIEEIRPNYALIENVAALRSRGLDTILGALATLGYHAGWDCIPACALGPPHRRDRIWIVAYPVGDRSEGDSRPILREPIGVAAKPRRAALRFKDDEAGPIVDGPMGQDPWWKAEPGVDRVAHGPAPRLDRRRLRALGNSLVPQIAELIGKAIFNRNLVVHDHALRAAREFHNRRMTG